MFLDFFESVLLTNTKVRLFFLIRVVYAFCQQPYAFYFMMIYALEICRSEVDVVNVQVIWMLVPVNETQSSAEYDASTFFLFKLDNLMKR